MGLSTGCPRGLYEILEKWLAKWVGLCRTKAEDLCLIPAYLTVGYGKQ